MIEHLLGTIIATSTEKEWYYLTIKVHDCAKHAGNCNSWPLYKNLH